MTAPQLRRTRRPWGVLALAVAALSAAAAESRAQGTAPPPNLQQMNEATFDSASAVTMIPRLRSILATSTDSSYTGMIRQMLLRAQLSSGASSKTLAKSADSTLAYLPRAPRNRIPFYASVAQALAERSEELPFALSYARRAYLEAPADDPNLPGIKAYAQGSLGYVFYQSGKYDSAIVHLRESLADSPDTQRVLLFLGRAYDRKGDADAAIAHWTRALSAFPPGDTSAAAELRAAYAKKHGSVDGLSQQLAAARRAAAENVALAPRRWERPSPPFQLADLDGKTFDSKALAGKVVLVDFWGSWCGPCRIELPLVEELYQKYRHRNDVYFLGINWERTNDPTQQQRIAREYMAKNSLTFPTVLDPQQKIANAFGVQGFPSAYVIDKTGQIRYRNVGVAEGIEHILEAQIESLLN